MCGIFCLINKKNNLLSKDKLFKSFHYINSRGSDENSQIYLDTNFNLSNMPNENLLAVMHSSRFATQGNNEHNKMPMISDKKNILCLNGDIYNFKEIKKVHLSNEKFYSDGDTEVFLKLFENFGINFVQYLNGDYASAIWHHNEKKFYFFVDYYTSKPLFYFNSEDYLIIASDIASISSFIGKQTLKKKFVQHYLETNYWQFSNIDYSLNAFEKIRQISGKLYLEYDIVNDILKFNNLDYKKIYFNKDNFPEIFEDSVKIRSYSNTKSVYTTLSGGLDSSAISLALFKKKIKTTAFTTENFGDDGRFTKIVSDNFNNLELKEINIGYNDDHLSNIQKLSSSMGIPIPIYGESLGSFKLFKKISSLYDKNIILTGHGGDELFGCQNNFFINILDDFIKHYGFRKVIKFIFLNFNKNNGSNLIKYFIKFVNNNYKGHYRSFKGDKIMNLLERQIDEINFTNFRQSSLLTDFVSINNNISLRMPFLDYRLRELVNLDFKDKINEKFDRLILRKYLKADLEAISLRKSKQGMRLLASNLFDKNKDKIFDTLMSTTSEFIDKKNIKKLSQLKKFNNKTSNFLIRLYSLSFI